MAVTEHPGVAPSGPPRDHGQDAVLVELPCVDRDQDAPEQQAEVVG